MNLLVALGSFFVASIAPLCEAEELSSDFQDSHLSLFRGEVDTAIMLSGQHRFPIVFSFETDGDGFDHYETKDILARIKEAILLAADDSASFDEMTCNDLNIEFGTKEKIDASDTDKSSSSNLHETPGFLRGPSQVGKDDNTEKENPNGTDTPSWFPFRRPLCRRWNREETQRPFGRFQRWCHTTEPAKLPRWRREFRGDARLIFKPNVQTNPKLAGGDAVAEDDPKFHMGPRVRRFLMKWQKFLCQRLKEIKHMENPSRCFVTIDFDNETEFGGARH